jgi:hypothetical protein
MTMEDREDILTEDRDEQLTEEQSPLVSDEGPRALPYLDSAGNYDPTKRQQPRPYDFRRDSTIDPRGFVTQADEYETKVFRQHMSERFQVGFPVAVENIHSELGPERNKPFSAFVDDLLERNRSAYDTTPDEASTKAILSTETGIAQDFLDDAEVLKDAKVRAQMKKDALALRNAPEKVAEWFKYPGALALARDDIDVFNALGGALYNLSIKYGPDRTATSWENLKIGIGKTLIGTGERREVAARAVGNETSWRQNRRSFNIAGFEPPDPGFTNIDWEWLDASDPLKNWQYFTTTEEAERFNSNSQQFIARSVPAHICNRYHLSREFTRNRG